MSRKPRRPRSEESYGRVSAFRDPRPRLLIVCEGRCTEPQYFEGLRKWFGLANVSVDCSRSGLTPLDVVEGAILIGNNASDKYDYIYCVFDGDRRPELRKAEPLLASPDANILNIKSIVSTPSFEYWLILHFEYTTAPMSAVEALRRLKTHLPSYTKNMESIFEQVKNSIAKACVNAENSNKNASSTSAENPTTNVHLVISKMDECRQMRD